MKIFLNEYAEILMYLLAAVVFAFIFFLGKKKVNFSIRVLTAMALGIVVGLIFSDFAKYLKVFGTVYTRLIKLIVVPLVFVSIIKSFTNLENVKSLKRIGLKTVFWLLFMTLIGAIMGVIAATVFKLGVGAPLPTGENPNETFTLVEALLNLIPVNIVSHAANNEVLQVIFFAILIAIAIIIEGNRKPERVKPFKEFINSASDIMNRVTKIIIRFTPYGVFGLVANAVSRNNAEAFKTLALYLLVIYAVMIVFFIVIQLGFITFVGRLNPFKWIRKIYPAQVVAMTTQSSLGTLPVSIKSLTRAGVSDQIANFSAPLGATMGMAACSGIFPAVVAVLTANAYGVELTFGLYATIVLSSVIASIGIAGVPGIASVAATVVLASVGLPLEGLLLVLAVEAFVDMGRTTVNVTGSLVAATITARSENEFDEEAFNADASADVEILE